MASPFSSNQPKARTQIVAIDLGARSTKAVQVAKKGEAFTMSNFAILDAPIFDKTISPELLAEHLRAINQVMGGSLKEISFVLGVADCVFRPTEVPFLPLEELRTMLKFGTKNYMQQDLPDHVFDCHIIASSLPLEAQLEAEGQKVEAPKHPAKIKVLAGGAKRQFLEDLQSAAKSVGMTVGQVVPGVVGPPNALELSQAEPFKNEVIGVVDIGFRNSSISILVNGELRLNRVMAIGGDKLTAGLAESMSINYAEAEGIKVGLSTEVESLIQSLLMPLGQELRASINFFEHQHDKTVNQVFICGGSARSEFIVQSLQAELMVPCSRWNAASFMTLELPPQQAGELEAAAPQLATAIGAAISAF